MEDGGSNGNAVLSGDQCLTTSNSMSQKSPSQISKPYQATDTGFAIKETGVGLSNGFRTPSFIVEEVVEQLQSIVASFILTVFAGFPHVSLPRIATAHVVGMSLSQPLTEFV